MTDKCDMKYQKLVIPPASLKVKRRCTGFMSSIGPSICPSVFPSVCPSDCGQNRFCSVSSRILAGFISYLHILSTTSEGVSSVKVIVKFQNLNFWQLLGICNFDFVLL